jgi:hypothetical protein
MAIHEYLTDEQVAEITHRSIRTVKKMLTAGSFAGTGWTSTSSSGLRVAVRPVRHGCGGRRDCRSGVRRMPSIPDVLGLARPQPLRPSCFGCLCGLRGHSPNGAL